MGLRAGKGWNGWKGLCCCLLSALLLSLSFSRVLRLLLLVEDAQGAWRHPTRHHENTAAPALSGVDFGSLFLGSALEPHCEPRQTLLILVASAPGNAGSRRVIRSTWAKRPLSPPHPWQAVFLVGQSPDKREARQIRREQRDFGDVLLGGYLDTYRNLTLKVLHGLKWATERCRPHFILKTDDDCFVNTDRLPTFLAEHQHGRLLLYAGSVFPREKRRVIRSPASKWYVSREDYSAEEYPPYASGIGYLLSLGAARRVLWAAERAPPIPVEDAFVGILAQRAGLRPTSSARFAQQNAHWHLCNYRFLMVIHHLNASEQQGAVRSMREAQAACRGRPRVTGWKWLQAWGATGSECWKGGHVEEEEEEEASGLFSSAPDTGTQWRCGFNFQLPLGPESNPVELPAKGDKPFPLLSLLPSLCKQRWFRSSMGQLWPYLQMKYSRVAEAHFINS